MGIVLEAKRVKSCVHENLNHVWKGEEIARKRERKVWKQERERKKKDWSEFIRIMNKAEKNFIPKSQDVKLQRWKKYAFQPSSAYLQQVFFIIRILMKLHFSNELLLP